jgi:putative hemolysin
MKFLWMVLMAGCGVVFAQPEEALLAELQRAQSPEKALELARRGPAATPFLVRGLQRNDRTAALCAWALVQHPHPGAAAALRGRLLNVDQVAGFFAARALGKIPSEENAGVLAALLPGEVNGFWELSSGGSGKLRDAWTEKGVRYNVKAPTNMPNLRVAYAAMESLGEIGGERAAVTLMRALTNDQYLIRHGAARGLGRMRHQPAAARLRELAASDPVLIVRRAAEQAGRFIAEPELAKAHDILKSSPLGIPLTPALSRKGEREDLTTVLPSAIAFIKTKHRSDATFGFRDSYFFPKTPRYHSGANIFSLTPPRPDGVLKNLTQLTGGEVQGLEVSFDGTKLLFAMRRDGRRDGFHIFEMNLDGSGLRQITDGNCNDVDPCYLPDGRIAFDSDRCGWQEYYHQERSRVLYVMNGDGSGITQITFNPNEDYEPVALRDGRLMYSSYRFYAQDGSEAPLRGEWMGLARIETVLRTVNPDGSADNLFYGAMRGSFYSPMRPMPFSDQFAGWHGRGYHVGVSVSMQREMADGRILCTTPAGLTVIETALAPRDCEMPVFPEVVNLAGGEEVYIHNYDEMNPVGRFTAPYPLGGEWALVSHAPWHDLRVNGYGLYAMNLATREMKLIYDDPQMADVEAVPLWSSERPLVRETTLAGVRPAATGRIFCNSVFNTDQPFDTNAVRYVRVLEGVQMGQSIAANASFRTRILGTAPVRADGSFFVEVPADVPVRFELLDEDGRMLVHETEFLSVRAGETKGCVGCHENRKEASPNAHPLALKDAPFKALRQRGDLIYFGQRTRPYNQVYRD